MIELQEQAGGNGLPGPSFPLASIAACKVTLSHGIDTQTTSASEGLPEDWVEDIEVADRSMTAMNVVIGSDVATVGESAIFVVPRPPLDKDGVFEYLESSVHEAGELRGGGEAGVGGPQLGPADYIDFSLAFYA